MSCVREDALSAPSSSSEIARVFRQFLWVQPIRHRVLSCALLDFDVDALKGRHPPRRVEASARHRPSPSGTARGRPGRPGPRGEQERGQQRIPAMEQVSNRIIMF